MNKIYYEFLLIKFKKIFNIYNILFLNQIIESILNSIFKNY